MRSRYFIGALVCAALASGGDSARATGPDLAPTSVDKALDQVETLISPEALAAFYATPEDDVRELGRS
jgi:hypothetical protein